MIVSISRPIVRTVLKGQTFKVDPISISTIGTLAPMHSMVICKGLVCVAHLGERGCKEPSTPMREKTSCGVVSIGTSFQFKVSKRAL